MIVRIGQILDIFECRANRISWWIVYKIQELVQLEGCFGPIRRINLSSSVLLISISYQFSSTRNG